MPELWKTIEVPVRCDEEKSWFRDWYHGWRKDGRFRFCVKCGTVQRRSALGQLPKWRESDLSQYYADKERDKRIIISRAENRKRDVVSRAEVLEKLKEEII